MQGHDLSAIKKFIVSLRILIIVAILMSAFETIFLFFSDKDIAFYLNETLWTKKISSFGIWDRFIVFDLLSLLTILWFAVLYQFWRLCDLYSQGKVFTTENTRCFRYIAWAIMGMALLETIEIAMIGAYLNFRGIVPHMPDLDGILMLELDLLTAGIFFWLVSKIMDHAALIREEAELTI